MGELIVPGSLACRQASQACRMPARRAPLRAPRSVDTPLNYTVMAAEATADDGVLWNIKVSKETNLLVGHMKVRSWNRLMRR